MINFYHVIKSSQESKQLLVVFSIVLLMFSILVYSIYYNLDWKNEHAQRVIQSQERIYQIERVVSLAKDYETGARGFIITNNAAYKEPFIMAEDSLEKAFSHLKKLVQADSVQENYRKVLLQYLNKKIAFSRLTIEVRQEKGLEAALRMVATNKGKIQMDKIRGIVNAMHAHELSVLNNRKKESEKIALQINLILLVGLVLFIFLLIYLLRKGWINISEKKIASEQLQQSQERFKALIENSSEAIVLRDKNLNIIYWSLTAEKIFGFTKEEVAQPGFDLVSHPEGQEQLAQHNQEVFHSPGIPLQKLIRLQHKNGHYLWVESKTTNLLHQESIQAIVFHFSDVSERVKDALEVQKANSLLEKAIWNEQRRFNNLFMQAPVSICVFKGTDHRYVLTNSLFDCLVGGRQVIGKTVEDAFPELAHQGLLEKLDRVYKTGQSYSETEQLLQLDRDGNGQLTAIYLDMLFQPYCNSDGKVEEIYFFGVDVSEQVLTRKKIEESEWNFRQLIQDLPAAVYTCDVTGRIKLFNKAAVELWGREPEVDQDFWCGSYNLYNTPGQILDRENCPMALTLKNGVAGDNQEIIMERPDGDRRYIMPHTVLSHDVDGQVTGGINILIDITESKIASEQIRRSEAALAEAQRIAKIGSWNLDLHSQKFSCSEQLYHIFDLNPEILQETFTSFLYFVDEVDRDLVRQTIQHAFVNREPFDIECRIITLKGERRVLHLLGNSQADASGLVIRLYGTAQDITERKCAEMQLQESEKNLKSILTSSQEAIYLLNSNCRLVLLNEQCRSILEQGYGITCKAGDDFPALFEPELRGKLRAIYQKVLAGEKWEAERVFSLEEDVYYYSTYFPVRDNEGQIIGICCSSKNITEEKKIEKAMEIANAEKEELQYRFKAILDYSPQAILIKDIEGKYIFANKAFLNLFDLDQNNEVSQQIKTIFDNQEVLAEFSANEHEDAQTIKSKEWNQQVMLNDGQTLEMEIIKFPLYDRQKRLFGICTLSKDITEQVKHQQQLIQARENAEHAERLQEQFLANMSHELRTPMNGIIGMANLLLVSSSLQPDQKGRLQIIKQSSNTLLSLINNILDLSKLKAGILTLEEFTFDFNESIAGTIPFFKERAQEKGIRLVAAADHFIPQLLVGDPHRLNQILSNLLSNAVKFTEKGFVRLEASLQSKKEDQVIIEFVVSDSGVGIDANSLHYIFDNFAQGSTDIASKYGGTGLGLAITRRLIEMQGGAISVESTKGKGTSFSFCLPYAIAKDSDTVVNLYRRNELSPVKKSYNGKRALIVEDNDINQAVLASSLRQFHMDLLIANHGGEAIQILESGEQFDIIFMDLRMPVMNGFEAITYIRQNLHLKVPIVVLTASVLRNEKERCLEIGASDYMAKPFDMTDLARALEQFLSVPLHQTEKQYRVESNGPMLSVSPATISLSGFDISRLLELEDPEYIRMVFDLFAEKMPSYLQELKSILPSGNWKEFLEKAHKAKGSLASVHIEEIYQLIVEMEKKVQEQQSLVDIEPLLERCLSLYPQLISAIHQEVEKQLITIIANL